MTMPWQVPAWPGLVWTWADAAKAAQGRFKPSRGAERAYARALRNLADKIAGVLATHTPGDAEEILRDYAETIGPWAQQAAANMVLGIERDNADKFARLAHRMGYDIRTFLGGDAVGQVVAARIEENARLIKSLVLDSALRAGELAHESLITGMRAEDMAEEIYGLNGVTKARAKVIAVTEVSKAATALTQARSEQFGSEGYIWRSVRDGATRPSHRAMEGKFVKWSDPPRLDGMTGHAGEFPNCRCYPEPVIPRSDGKGVYRPMLPTQEEERESGQRLLRTQWEKAVGSEVIPHLEGEPLPNVDKAKFDFERLTTYSMNANAVKKDGTPNESARSKARAFKKWLDFTDKDAPKVEKQVMAQLAKLKAIPKAPTDIYGQRFNVYVPVIGNNGREVDVMTAWIYDRDYKEGKSVSTHPRMINCYIDTKKIDENGKYKGN
ncbi:MULTISPECIES: phage minor head protein [unclassified Desulfovibrio]|uniref:phage head morphogenesis protein n=1 Tax=unclassified Desulfovibrio TaxID=2593640 RepID=UPI0013EA7BA1|nr:MULTISPECIES: phage minor head protein [unclassified Desulfovibrio]